MHRWELVIEGDQDMQRHQRQPRGCRAAPRRRQRLVIAIDQDLQQHQVMRANAGLRIGAGSAPRSGRRTRR